ncbi:MAG: prevent-host-death protein, partial [Bacteroidales bacterium]|nr:prevent-host-death protein [Bacteroidales bacterium]
NPNHFADYISLGGGAVTALSSQTLGASDFFTGAFPAEFGNALSGVFDMNLRSGNQDKREHTFQASLIGIDLASEGPFKKGKSSTYLFNYRYSTLGLLSPILPEEMGKLSYQDLSFKIDFPARNGVFSVWGIGAYDFQGKEAVQDPAKWKDNEDREEFKARLNMGALGVNYKKVIGKSTYMRTTLAVTENSLVWKQKRFDSSLFMQPIRDVEDYRWKYSVSAMINHKFSARHTNRTGVILNRIMYDLDINYAEGYGNPLKTYISEEKGSELLQFYSQSKIHLNRNVVANVGLHSQYFTLNGNHTLEPRLGLSWNFNPRQALSLAYGMHSQLELLQFYFVEQNTPNGIIQPNKNLDFNKAHHFVVAYENQLKENLNLTIETYYQKLFDIPVVPGSHVSTININEIWDFNDSLVNQGTGENIGLDITLERYLNQGLYYMLTASFFDSKYTGGDGIKRNTKYNRGYVVNVLAGKEWKTGKKDQNLLNANIRLTHMGGRRIIPVDTYETLIREEIILDISRAYEQQLEDAPILSASFNLRINKRNHASVWSFHIINALGHKEFQEFEYNAEERKINKVEDLLIIPNIGYKIEF